MTNLQEVIDENLYMPFALAESPHQHQVATETNSWLDRFGITDDLKLAGMIEYTQPARLAAYNGATLDRDILQLVANQIAYQFIFDDYAEEVGMRDPVQLLPMLFESVGILQHNRPPRTRLGAMLADLFGRVRQHSTHAQAARWATYGSEYAHGLIYEAIAQSNPDSVPLDQTRVIRSLTAGVRPFYPLYEAAQHDPLNEEELHRPEIRALEHHSANAAVWIPDLYSAPKERQSGQIVNLVLAYQRADGGTMLEAVMKSIQKINETIRKIEAIYDGLQSQLSQPAIGYVRQGLFGWISGCYYWSRTVPRYAAA